MIDTSKVLGFRKPLLGFWGWVYLVVFAPINLFWVLGGDALLGSPETVQTGDGAMLFLLVATTLLFLYGVVSRSIPVVTLVLGGIRDTRLAEAFIRWTDIKQVSTRKIRNRDVIALTLDPVAASMMPLTIEALYDLSAHGAIFVTTRGLANISHDALLETITAYWMNAQLSNGQQAQSAAGGPDAAALSA